MLVAARGTGQKRGKGHAQHGGWHHGGTSTAPKTTAGRVRSIKARLGWERCAG